MELIDKDALVAEIEKVIDEPTPLHDPQCPWEDGYWCGLYKVESIIDTIEVKEVDLEGEIEKVKKMYNCLELKEETIIDFCAKHFFELGLKSKGE